MPDVKLYPTDNYCTYCNMIFGARALSKVNPSLVKAEREFIAGKRYSDIKVSGVMANGDTRTGPVKLPTDKVL